MASGLIEIEKLHVHGWSAANREMSELVSAAKNLIKEADH